MLLRLRARMYPTMSLKRYHQGKIMVGGIPDLSKPCSSQRNLVSQIYFRAPHTFNSNPHQGHQFCFGCEPECTLQHQGKKWLEAYQTFQNPVLRSEIWSIRFISVLRTLLIQIRTRATNVASAASPNVPYNVIQKVPSRKKMVGGIPDLSKPCSSQRNLV
eukprot:PhF_6_TR37484/c0_g2_i1/m.55265